MILSNEQLNFFRFLYKPLISGKDFYSSLYHKYEIEQKKSLSLRKEEIDITRQSYNAIIRY